MAVAIAYICIHISLIFEDELISLIFLEMSKEFMCYHNLFYLLHEWVGGRVGGWTGGWADGWVGGRVVGRLRHMLDRRVNIGKYWQKSKLENIEKILTNLKISENIDKLENIGKYWQTWKYWKNIDKRANLKISSGLPYQN